MCGVCGIASFVRTSERETTRQRVSPMLGALAHRGPDESGFLADKYAALGATRLAIRGIHDGTQPIVDRDSGVVVVCNGEIDNHRELREWLAAHGRLVAQATDIAVISGLYLELGEHFVERLVGAFAIGVWDPQEARLLLARDRTGERPLFFAIRDGGVSFATEISALATNNALPLTVAKTAVHQYLQSGVFLAPTSPFNEIQKVAPAEIVTIGAGRVRRRRYWRWNLQKTPKRKPSLDTFDGIFREAVRRQSDVDVEYGVFLSGGLDSSLVAAVTRSIHPERPLKAYTIRFDESSYEEGDYAATVAKLFRMESVTVPVGPEHFPTEIAKIIRLVGEPLADQSWIPSTLLARRAAQDVKLALVGEGADELFGGYPTYIGAQIAQHYSRLPRVVRTIIKTVVEKWPATDKKVTLSFLLKRFVQGQELDGVSRHLLWTANIPPALLERLGVKNGELRRVDRLEGPLLDAMQELDLETSLAEGLLTEKDRSSMSSAVELRSPYLDQAVLEFAATLPVNERVRGVTTKAFLKRYAERYLPKKIVHRRKRGLTVPFSNWLRGPLYEWADAKLGAELLRDVGINSGVARVIGRTSSMPSRPRASTVDVNRAQRMVGVGIEVGETLIQTRR